MFGQSNWLSADRSFPYKKKKKKRNSTVEVPRRHMVTTFRTMEKQSIRRSILQQRITSK